jgi:hypothetical protein
VLLSVILPCCGFFLQRELVLGMVSADIAVLFSGFFYTR